MTGRLVNAGPMLISIVVPLREQTDKQNLVLYRTATVITRRYGLLRHV